MSQFNAADLLDKGKDTEYPPDYLLSRLRGRKARLIRDWAPLVASPAPLEKLAEGHYQRVCSDISAEGIWKALLIEYQWVYYQMNAQLRKIFGPFFLYTELRTIFICLRNLKDMKRAGAKEMLSASLLSEELREILSESADEFAAVREIEERLRRLSGQFIGIAEILRQKGLSGFERELTKRYLTVIVGAGLDPFLQIFFMRLIDARNALALVKLLKLDSMTEHHFIAGGRINIVRLREVLQSRDRSEIARLLRGLTGEEIDPAEHVKLEAALYRGITRSLKKEGRSTLSTGPIIEYLWRCSIEAMNLSMLCYTVGMERHLVAAELVQ
jgi:vacuolar-type H+-ATPase subunit C/Vma6